MKMYRYSEAAKEAVIAAASAMSEHDAVALISFCGAAKVANDADGSHLTAILLRDGQLMLAITGFFECFAFGVFHREEAARYIFVQTYKCKDVNIWSDRRPQTPIRAV
jgi:hypothetical protein